MEDLPPEVLARVLALVPARQLARCAAVCRLWRQLAAADSLWERHWERDEKGYEAGPFAEKFLREGRRALCAHPPPLPPRLASFSARCQLPRCVVVDAGSGYCKYGWSEQLRPSGTVPTFLEFGNIESPTLPRLKKLYTAVFNSLGAKAPLQPVIISEPLCYSTDLEASRQQRRLFRQMTCEVLFEKLKVPAICSVDQAFLALIAAQMRSGIVINIGFRNTTVLPVFNGKPLRSLTTGLLALGAMRLTTVLSDLMDRAHLHYMSMFTVRTIKEELCYVAQNYDEEMDKPLEKASCDVRGEGVFDLDQQRFQAPEILFQPALCGSSQEEGLAQLVASCMERCAEVPVADPEDAGWFHNVLLMGGSACIPGLPERLQKDLTALVSPSLREGVHVIPPTHGPHAPWFGAKVISNLSTMPQNWCVTREQYQTLGMDYVHAMSCDDD
jgi:actin-related protein 8